MDANVPTQPGDQLIYTNQVSFGAVTSRREVIITPQAGADFKAGRILRIEIPAQDYVDPAGIYLTMATNIYAGAGNSWVSGAVAATPVALNADSGIPYLTEVRQLSTHPNCMKTVRFKPGVQCIFSRIKVLAGSTVIEDIQDYAELYRFMLEATTSPEWRKNDGAAEEGFYDPSNVAQNIAAANHHSVLYSGSDLATKVNYDSLAHYYTVRPMVGLFSINKLLPVKYMGNLTLEFYMAENADCLWSTSSARMSTKTYELTPTAQQLKPVANAPHFHQTAFRGGYYSRNDTNAANKTLACASYDGSSSLSNALLGYVTTDFPNAYYTVTDVQLHVPFVTVLPDYDRTMLEKIESEGLDLHFSTYHTHVRQLAGLGRQTLSFTERSLSVKGGFMIMRNSDDLRDIRSDMTFYSNNIEWYQWKIGNEYIPTQRVQCDGGAALALAQLKLALGTFDNFGQANNITDIDYLPTHVAGNVDTEDVNELLRQAQQPSKFAIGLTLEKSPGQMSGFDSAAAGVDIEIQVSLRNHTARFPTAFSDTKKFLGHKETLWQPSKFKCHITGTPDTIVAYNADPPVKAVTAHYCRAQIYGYQDSGDVILRDITGAADESEFRHHQPGIMISKDLTTVLTYADTVGFGDGQANSSAMDIVTYPQTVVSSNGKYTRVSFYAHVDSLMRLRRVGQIEVVV